jgi:hypothetical protein
VHRQLGELEKLPDWKQRGFADIVDVEDVPVFPHNQRLGFPAGFRIVRHDDVRGLVTEIFQRSGAWLAAVLAENCRDGRRRHMAVGVDLDVPSAALGFAAPPLAKGWHRRFFRCVPHAELPDDSGDACERHDLAVTLLLERRRLDSARHRAKQAQQQDDQTGQLTASEHLHLTLCRPAARGRFMSRIGFQKPQYPREADIYILA